MAVAATMSANPASRREECRITGGAGLESVRSRRRDDPHARWASGSLQDAAGFEPRLHDFRTEGQSLTGARIGDAALQDAEPVDGGARGRLAGATGDGERFAREQSLHMQRVVAEPFENEDHGNSGRRAVECPEGIDVV